jgi:hypothetical protein
MMYRYYLADDIFCDIRVYFGKEGRYLAQMGQHWRFETVVPEDSLALWQVPDTWLILARVPLYTDIDTI